MTFEARCPDEDFGPGFTNLQSSAATYTSDALVRHGTLEHTVFDAAGAIVCQSVHDVEAVSLGCD